MQTRVASVDDRTTAVVPEGAPKLPSRVSWGAVLSGGLIAVAVGAMLNVLGVAIGFSTIDPATAGGTPNASTLGIAGGVWLMIANLIGLAVGGYVAARLSGTSDDTDGVLHGLSVWAVGFLISAVLLGNVVAGTASSLSSMVGGAASGAGQAIALAAPAVNPDAITDRLQNALQTGGNPAQMTSDQRKAELAQLLGDRAISARLEPATRDRMALLAAAEFNIPPQEAAERIQRMDAEATRLVREAETAARNAADTAAKSASVGSYWLFAAMLLGALAAVLGARAGTRAAVVVAGPRYN